MIYVRMTVRFSLLFLLALSFSVNAQTAADAAAQVEKLQTSSATKQDALETVKNRLLAYEAKIDDATAQLEKAQQDLQTAQSNMDIANNDSSEDGERQRSLAQRRLELAERGFQSREKRLNRVSRKRTELQAEADKLAADLNWINRQLSEQQEKVAILKEREARAAAVAAATPEPISVATPAPVVTPEPEPEAIEVVQESDPAPQLSEATPVPAPIATQEPERADEKLEKLSPRKRYARNEMKKLNELTKNADKRVHRRYTELLMEINRDEVVELEYLGAEQFFTEIQLSEGKHKLTVNLKKYIVQIPESADGDTFVVIYDTTNLSSPRFVFFNKKLLD